MNEKRSRFACELRTYLWVMLLLCVPVTLVLASLSHDKTRLYLIILGYLEVFSCGIFQLKLIRDLVQARKELAWGSAFLEAQINASHDGILGMSSEGKKLFQNQRLNELWKIPLEISASDDDARWIQFASDQTRNPQSFVARIRYLHSHPHEVSRDEIELKDGTLLDRSSYPVIGTDGQSCGRIWMFRDLTEKKHQDAQHLRRQRMESIGSVAGGIVHDLNNALAPILVATETLRSECATAEGCIMLDLIRSSARRGSEMIRQVLAFARGNENQHGLVRVGPLLAEIAGIVRHTFPKVIRFKTNLSPEVWSVSGNRTQLHQVLLNLCVNARDAMPSGGMLTINACNTRVEDSMLEKPLRVKAGMFLLLTVTDTGCGMSEEVRPHIFEPFFTTKSPDKGTGLGLSTIYRIIEGHHGFITVYSAPNEGTEFKVYLPIPESAPVLDPEIASFCSPNTQQPICNH